MNVKTIAIESLHPAVHGVGAVLVVRPDGLGLALIAYGKATGSIGGILESYSGGPLGSDSCDLEAAKSLLERADWILAHGARETKAEMIRFLPSVERKAWVCSQGLLCLPAQETTAKPLTIPGPLEQTIQLVEGLGQGNKLQTALHRAGIAPAQA